MRIVIGLLITFIALASTSTASATHDCDQYCVSCRGKNYCKVCYRRRPFAYKDGEWLVCAIDPLPASDHCLIAGSENCRLCEPGYARTTAIAYKNCIPGTIEGCYFEDVQNGRHVCNSCLRGYPSDDLSRCIPASEIKNKIEFCKIGSFAGSPGYYSCQECEEGYTTNLRSCFKTPAALKGCLRTDYDKIRCVVCDFTKGYFSRDTDYKCATNVD